MVQLHPTKPNRIASRIRAFAFGTNLKKNSDWLVIQKAIEAMSTFPYQEKYITNISRHFCMHEHPLVRRAALSILPRAPKEDMRKYLREMTRHPDPGVSRLAQFLGQLCWDTKYAPQEISKLKNSNHLDNVLIRRIYQLYAASATTEESIATVAHEATNILDRTKSQKLIWHRDNIRERTKWCFDAT